MPIKVTTTTDGENKRKQKPKSLQSKRKHKKNKCFLESVLRLLSLAVNHSTPHLCRMPSNTVLIAGPVWGRATQFLIWSYCAFLWILEWICAVTELKDLLKTGQNIWSSGCEKPGHQAREELRHGRDEPCSYPACCLHRLPRPRPAGPLGVEGESQSRGCWSWQAADQRGEGGRGSREPCTWAERLLEP